MPHPIPHSVQEAAAATVQLNPRSYDFRGERELEWDSIEIALGRLYCRAEAVEYLGRTAVDSIHSTKMADAFDLVATDIFDEIVKLKALLGLSEDGGLRS